MAPRQEVIQIFASPDEVAAGKLKDANVREVLEGLHTDGIEYLNSFWQVL